MYHLFLVLTFAGGGFSAPYSEIVNNKAFAEQSSCSGYAVRAIKVANQSNFGKVVGRYDCIYVEE